ncbi:MAG: hypothetical protein HY352_06370 [Candidatus Omnitrophica bacterium]|nr:hypothetical protein [Candidatus Omnitrophota bacterium]
MALRRLIGPAAVIVCSVALIHSPAWADEHQRTPSMMHGAAKIIGGLIFEWPKTIVDATVEGPPIAGTIVGVLAGAARAVQTVVAGAVEMATAFDPFGAKSRE